MPMSSGFRRHQQTASYATNAAAAAYDPSAAPDQQRADVHCEFSGVTLWAGPL
jgi:hypothetical protein